MFFFCVVFKHSSYFTLNLGGKFDNGGRFDLRLPYADQGYVDEDADFMGKLGQMFGGKKKVEKKVEEKTEPPKKNKWPWEK